MTLRVGDVVTWSKTCLDRATTLPVPALSGDLSAWRGTVERVGGGPVDEVTWVVVAWHGRCRSTYLDVDLALAP